MVPWAYDAGPVHLQGALHTAVWQGGAEGFRVGGWVGGALGMTPDQSISKVRCTLLCGKGTPTRFGVGRWCLWDEVAWGWVHACPQPHTHPMPPSFCAGDERPGPGHYHDEA